MSLTEIVRDQRILLTWLEGTWSGGHPADRALVALRGCFEAGGTLFITANGGSCSQGSHLAAELIGASYCCVNLGADPSVLTALSNDASFVEVFSHQIAVLGKPGDILLAISTSGRSKNILRALRVAEAYGVKRITLTGNLGNSAAALSEYPIVVPSNNTQRIQEIHLMILHHWYEQLRVRCDCIERGIP